ncbi:hypothetical protein ABPG75_001568 [Micractinium tetrahymenae]
MRRSQAEGGGQRLPGEASRLVPTCLQAAPSKGARRGLTDATATLLTRPAPPEQTLSSVKLNSPAPAGLLALTSRPDVLRGCPCISLTPSVPRLAQSLGPHVFLPAFPPALSFRAPPDVFGLMRLGCPRLPSCLDRECLPATAPLPQPVAHLVAGLCHRHPPLEVNDLLPSISLCKLVLYGWKQQRGRA